VSLLTLRPLMPEDRDATRALIASTFGGTRYLAWHLEQLDAALAFEDPEYMALLAADEHDSLVGLALFGTVAGASRCTKLHAVAGASHDAVGALLEAVAELCDQSGERLIVCELPDDLPFRSLAASLLERSYVEEGRVADYVRDGVALRLLVRRP
jgi:hypothetical protein